MLQPIPAESVPELLASRDGYENVLANLRNMRKAIDDLENQLSIGYLPVSGGTLTGPLILAGGASVPSGQTLAVDGTLSLNSPLEIKKGVSKVAGVNTQGPFGVNAVVASVSEVKLVSTNTSTIMNFVPQINGNFLIYIYLRVDSISTGITMDIQYVDGGGAQDQILLSNTIQSKGSYSLPPFFINSVANSPINITAKASIANQVFISASIIGL
jgi:hypothetical protein